MHSPLTHAWFATPFGELHVLADREGVVRASGLRGFEAIAAQLPAGLKGAGWVEGDLPHAADAVAAWLGGDAAAITRVPVSQDGGPFFQDVWRTLRTLPAGEPVSYQELAAAAGRPLAMRAVGTACARNAVAPFVPCHRVINAGGKLGSYGYGGPASKAAMLALEAGADAAGIARAARSAHAGSQAPSRPAGPDRAAVG